MKSASVIFGPDVDAAITLLIDYVDPSDIPTVIRFLERIQMRLVQTLSTLPEGGSRFQGNVRMMVVDKYTFLYEYHASKNEVHVLEMIAPGQDWR
ncbi:hypothetical protein [Roseovarius sp. EL26]|uniref:hypothetical protein n=1 Tax=Roseovarius sp. EL26 TaxID=2126672 RepID=UPI000EA08B6C|nr:hypothetical protein [Roseovarius sp. EL26]